MPKKPMPKPTSKSKPSMPAKGKGGMMSKSCSCGKKPCVCRG